jgi:hypothetical protein
MNKEILKMAGIGVAVVIVVVSAIWFGTLGSQIRLSGEIQQVRLLGMQDNSTIVIVDFRFVNPADYPFVVRDATVHLVDADGLSSKGTAIAAGDVQRIFDYYSKEDPDLGEAYNEVFKARDRVEPGENLDRMIAARFEVPEPVAAARQLVKLRIEDVDGAVTELEEERESD